MKKLLAKSKSLNEEKNYEQVVSLLQDDLLEKWNNSDLYAELGEALCNLERMTACEIVVEKSIKINTLHPKTNYLKGTLLRKNGLTDQAKEYFLKCLCNDPSFALAHNDLGFIFMLERNYSKAIESFQRSIEADPKLTKAYFNLASHYFDQKE